MKTLRDTNNNNSNTTNHPTQQHFSPNTSSSSTINRHNFISSNQSVHQNSDAQSMSYPSLLNQNHRGHPQTNWRANNDQSSSSKVTASSANPSTSLFNGDLNQLPTMIQTYLTKFGGNQLFQPDTINPLVYLQLMNANTMFMQQLSSLQNNTNNNNPSNDLPTEAINSGRNSQTLQADSSVFVPKIRPMTQDQIAEHARSVYQRALQRNQLQQHNDLMKHFYQSLNIKQPGLGNPIFDSSKSIDHPIVPSVPNASNIGSIGTFDVLDTLITSPSSCLSMKEPSVDTVISSVSLLSVDDAKMISNTGSLLDPGAPVFIPRQSRPKSDDDHETSSSSSDSDFNDFHFLDQFIEEFYSSNHEHDNHLIIPKSPSSDETNNDDDDDKHPIHHHALGQGDAIEQKIDELIEQRLSTSNEKSECQYSVYQLLHRYRNPRCHLVLPEWSRLSVILPNVCSMRSHTYKIKRYFAYRRRLSKDHKLTHLPVQS